MAVASAAAASRVLTAVDRREHSDRERDARGKLVSIRPDRYSEERDNDVM